nr:hypothetical protein [Tanacetum cinerariifolium]
MTRSCNRPSLVFFLLKTCHGEGSPELGFEEDRLNRNLCQPSGLAQMATKGNLGEVVTTCERGLGFKPRRRGFPSGAKNEWGLSPKANVRVLHTAQFDVTVSSNH